MIDSKELALKAAKFLDEKGANDIVILDVGHMTSITDYFVIVNGRNVQAVHTLAEDLEDKLAELIIADYERKISNAKICIRNGELTVACI